MKTVRQVYDEAVPVGKLRLHEQNANRGASGVIAESIEKNGFYGAIYAHEATGQIIAGNHRWEEAVKAGAETVPVIWLDVDEAEARRILAVDNRSARLGSDDDAKLAELLESFGGDFDGTGYDQENLDALLRELGDASRPLTGDPDAVSVPPKVPVTQPGDMWIVGDHRVLSGDATVRADYDRVLTDMEGDLDINEVEKLWKESFAQLYDVMPGGCPYYIFGPQGGDLGLLLLLLRDSGLAPRHILIWVKNRASFSIGRLDYDYQHEPIVYGWRPGGPHPWHAEASKTSTLHYDRPQASPDHPTVKPFELIHELIANSTLPGELVLDPFAGSGTTLVAAHALGRRARLIEKAPGYVDVILRRAQTTCGLVPILERTGEERDFTLA